MAWMGDNDSVCVTCKYYGTHQGKEPCKSCKFLGIITEGNLPSNYVEKDEERSSSDKEVSMEIFKFNFKDSINYEELERGYNEIFIAHLFTDLDVRYSSLGYLYLRDVLDYFGMVELSKTVPMWLGWDKSRGHEFRHYYEEILTTFDLMITLNPYDISKGADENGYTEAKDENT